MRPSRIRQAAIPSAAPTPVPRVPIAAPCAMKSAMMLRRVAPMDRRMAMSRVFSVTVTIWPATMLSAATPTMKLTKSAVASFSSQKAEKSVVFRSIQLSVENPGPSVPRMPVSSSRTANMSVALASTWLASSARPVSRCASASGMSAHELS